MGVILDGPPPVQEAIRGRAAAALRGLALLEEAGVPFRVTTVVSAASVDTLDRLVFFLAQFRMARGIGLDRLPRPAGTGRAEPAHPPDRQPGPAAGAARGWPALPPAAPWRTAAASPEAIFDCGPARIAILDATLLRHPEQALARAKQGCDLAIFFLERLDEPAALLTRVRAIEQLAALALAPGGSLLCLPPKGHEPWRQHLLGPEGGLLRLDARETRQKRFQDMIDYPRLLQNSPLPMQTT